MSAKELTMSKLQAITVYGTLQAAPKTGDVQTRIAMAQNVKAMESTVIPYSKVVGECIELVKEQKEAIDNKYCAKDKEGSYTVKRNEQNMVRGLSLSGLAFFPMYETEDLEKYASYDAEVIAIGKKEQIEKMTEMLDEKVTFVLETLNPNSMGTEFNNVDVTILIDLLSDNSSEASEKKETKEPNKE